MGQDWNRYKKHDRLHQAFLKWQEEEFVDDQAKIDDLLAKGGLPAIDLSEFELDPEVVAILPKDVMMKHALIPINRAGGTLIVAVAHACSLAVINELEFLTGYRIELVYAGDEQIREAIDKA